MKRNSIWNKFVQDYFGTHLKRTKSLNDYNEKFKLKALYSAIMLLIVYSVYLLLMTFVLEGPNVGVALIALMGHMMYSIMKWNNRFFVWR